MGRAEALGLKIDLLSGQEEGHAAACGVLSAIPHAEGSSGDLGGGSLELVRVSGGKVRESVSLPLGVLRIPEVRGEGNGWLERHVKKLHQKMWMGQGHTRPALLSRRRIMACSCAAGHASHGLSASGHSSLRNDE